MSIQKYNANLTPDPSEWQSLDEAEQIDFVEEFHRESGVTFEEGAAMLHSAIHVVVENQLALGFEDVSSAISRLVHQGLDRHEALHAVGAILSEDTFEILKSDQKSWNRKKYRRRLEKLTAKRWKKGQW